MKNLFRHFLLLVFFVAPAFANVLVSSPQSGETVNSSATFVASANTSTCSRGVASMGVYIDNQLAYVVNGTTMHTTLALSPGRHYAVVQEWDYCGGATLTPVPITVADQANVWVTSPAANSSSSPIANYVATATSSCSKGVAAMGVYVNNQLAYVVSGANLNTQLTLQPGAQHTVVQEWDNCGGSSTSTVDLNVVGIRNTFTNLQMSKWNSWGQLAPTYADCPDPCPGVHWSLSRGIQSPSLSGNASQFSIGGTTPYSDVLWSNPLIGQFSTQGLPDTDEKLIPTLHNFTYDAYFYYTDDKATQALEFDINMFLQTVGMTWGTECRIEGGNEWDIWDNANAVWVPTGIPCHPTANQWNHVTINAKRGPNNTLIYQSITLNGVTANINKTYPPFTVPPSWYGITVNYQVDGDHKQNSITTYVDNFSFTYW